MNRRFSKEDKQALMEAAALLREQGLSFKAIGKDLGLSHATVHRWINKEAGAKHIEYNKRYSAKKYKENPEPIKEKGRAYYHANKEKAHETYRRNYEKTKEQRREYSRRYRAENADKMKEYTDAHRGEMAARLALRRAKKRNATPKWLTKEQRRQIQSLYVQSARLADETGVKHEVDHIHPLQHADLCGLHVPWNLRIITKSENSAKSNSFLPELGLTA
jgi:predicted transcriptional regulator